MWGCGDTWERRGWFSERCLVSAKLLSHAASRAPPPAEPPARPTARPGAQHLLPPSPPHASGFAMTKDWLPSAVLSPAAGWRSSHLTGTAAACFSPFALNGFILIRPEASGRIQLLILKLSPGVVHKKQQTEKVMPQRCMNPVTFLGPIPTGSLLICERARCRCTH